MRASPAFRICIRRYGVWRAGVGVLLGATLAAQLAWLAGRLHEAPLAAVLPWIVIDVTLLAVAAAALRVAPVELHWDTRRWRVGTPGSDAAQAEAGRVAVAVDLGPWMLLRFDADAPAARPRRRWLPVQRGGLEGQWHALRCAVYCARPAVGPEAGATLGAGPPSQE